MRFDDVVSSCSREEADGEVYLVVEPVEGLPEGYEVLDYVWVQREGNEVQCEDR